MNAYPGENSVLLLDNASIHHSDEVAELCTEAGVVLEFLPPYAPQFAPVETVFYNIKSWIRANRDWIESLPKEDVGFVVLRAAIDAVVHPGLTKSLYRKVRIFGEE
jgi:transposase